MKCVISGVVFMLALSSGSFAGFDYVIESTYAPGTTMLNSQSLLILGAGAELVDAQGSSYIEVYATTKPLQVDVGGIAVMDLRDSSLVNYLGGETELMTLANNATATLKGGRVDYLNSRQYVLGPNQTYIPHIEIVCKEHEYDNLTKRLTGVWMDDTTFNIQLVNQSGYDPVIENIFFTPEPATLLLFALGGLALRRRR